MKDFKKIAKDNSSNSFVTNGREAIQTDLLIAAYPNGITVIGADLLKGSKEENGVKIETEYAACLFAEDDTKYFNAGKALTDIVRSWLDGYESSEDMSNDLQASGGVKIKLSKKTTKKGNRFTEVTVID